MIPLRLRLRFWVIDSGWREQPAGTLSGPHVGGGIRCGPPLGEARRVGQCFESVDHGGLIGSHLRLPAARSGFLRVAGDHGAKGRGRHRASCPGVEQCRHSRVRRSPAARSHPLARAEASVPGQARVWSLRHLRSLRLRRPARLLPSLIDDLVPGDREDPGPKLCSPPTKRSSARVTCSHTSALMSSASRGAWACEYRSSPG
jgi:hypothetical protein